MTEQGDDLKQLKTKLESSALQAQCEELIDGEEAFLDLRRLIEGLSR